MARKAGGQAVFEGVMMRGDDRWAVAVRTPTGEIEVLTAELPQFAPRLKKVPLLRGILALAEAMPLGARALKWSAVHGLGQTERKATPWERVVQAATIVAVVCAVVTLSLPPYKNVPDFRTFTSKLIMDVTVLRRALLAKAFRTYERFPRESRLDADGRAAFRRRAL